MYAHFSTPNPKNYGASYIFHHWELMRNQITCVGIEKISLFNCITHGECKRRFSHVQNDARQQPKPISGCMNVVAREIYVCALCMGCAIASNCRNNAQHQNNTSAYTWRWHRQFNAFHCTYENYTQIN